MNLSYHIIYSIAARTYIGDQVHKSSKVYARLGEVLGLKEESVVLSIIVRKIVDALDYWARR